MKAPSRRKVPPSTKPPRESPEIPDLKRRAELRLRQRRTGPGGKAEKTPHELDARRLVHELQVHQIELEMQNAELQEARDRQEALLEKYTDLYDFSPAGYFTLAPDGTIRLANLSGSLLVGVDRSRLVGQRFGLFLAQDLRPAFKAFLGEVFGQPTKHSGDFGMAGGGGTARLVNIKAQAFPDGKECRAVVTDITARRQAEDKIRVSELRYRRLFEAAHDGVLILDPGTRKITDANPFMTKLLGYPHDQLVGKELFEIGLLRDEAASQEMFRQLRRNHQVRYEDLPLESRRGRRQEVEVVANLYQEDGTPVIQCNIRDITERHRAEEVLHRNQALFSALVAQVPVGVYVVDATFRLHQVNPVAVAAFNGITPLVGRDFAEVIRIVWPKRVAGPLERRFRNALATGEPYSTTDFTERRNDLGTRESYEWQIQRVTLPAGEFGVVCFFKNVTEQRRAAAAQRRIELLAASNQKLEGEIARRRKMQASLQTSEREQRRLVGQSLTMQAELRHLSHQILKTQEEERKRISRELHDEITQILVGIRVHLETLAGEAASDPALLRRKIARTRRLVEKSVDVVHQFARELRPPTLDHLGLVSTLHAFLKDFMNRTGIRVRLTAFNGLEETSLDRRTVLYRVAHEALTNVERHAGASEVEVSLRRQPGLVRMTVADDGKSFDTVHALRPRRNGRLGLLGMRERLEMVGGSLSVQSAPGKGTTITADVPFGTVRRKGVHTVAK